MKVGGDMKRRGAKSGPSSKGRPKIRKKPTATISAGYSAEEFDRLKRERDEALEHQTATSEVLQVISSSLKDTQPVFDAIVQSGLRLFPGALVSVALRYGEMINAAAVAALDPARVEAWRHAISHTPSRGTTCTAQLCLIAGSRIFPTWRMPRRNLPPGDKTS